MLSPSVISPNQTDSNEEMVIRNGDLMTDKVIAIFKKTKQNPIIKMMHRVTLCIISVFRRTWHRMTLSIVEISVGPSDFFFFFFLFQLFNKNKNILLHPLPPRVLGGH